MWSKRKVYTDQEVDEQLKETFPASDPPSWTLGHDPDKDFMKAMQVRHYGGPEQLHQERVPIPGIKSTDILVKVCCASVNPIDCKLASGALRPVMNNKAIPLPWIPGCDFSGIVENMGEDVLGFEKGDEVYGNCPAGGAYSEFVITQPNALAIKPSKLDFIDAASVPVAALTAWQALFDHAGLEKSQRVLIHGGSGGVGSFAVQLAHWKGAMVMATGSREHMEYLRELGADEAIDYKSVSFDAIVKDVDVVIDLIGGETQERSFTVLKEGGFLISTVSAPSQEKARRYKVHAAMMTMKPSAEQLKELSALFMEGKVKTQVTKSYSLVQARDAWVDILSHHNKGKIVLEVS